MGLNSDKTSEVFCINHTLKRSLIEVQQRSRRVYHGTTHNHAAKTVLPEPRDPTGRL